MLEQINITNRVSSQQCTDRKVALKEFLKIDKIFGNSPAEPDHPPHKKQGWGKSALKAYKNTSERIS